MLLLKCQGKLWLSFVLAFLRDQPILSAQLLEITYNFNLSLKTCFLLYSPHSVDHISITMMIMILKDHKNVHDKRINNN